MNVHVRMFRARPRPLDDVGLRDLAHLLSDVQLGERRRVHLAVRTRECYERLEEWPDMRMHVLRFGDLDPGGAAVCVLHAAAVGVAYDYDVRDFEVVHGEGESREGVWVVGVKLTDGRSAKLE